jgi:hypothetical protein
MIIFHVTDRWKFRCIEAKMQLASCCPIRKRLIKKEILLVVWLFVTAYTAG